MIDWNGKLKTKSGLMVESCYPDIAYKSSSNQVLVYLWAKSKGRATAQWYSLDGHFFNDGMPSSLDLINY